MGSAKVSHLITLDRMEKPTAGKDFLIRRLQEAQHGSQVYPSLPSDSHTSLNPDYAIGFTVLVGGVVTVSFVHRGVDIASNARSYVYKNKSLVIDWHVNGSTWETREVDVTVGVGDAVMIVHKAGSVPSAMSMLVHKEHRIYSGKKVAAVA